MQPKLGPITEKQRLVLHDEVEIKVNKSKGFDAAVSSHILMENRGRKAQLMISLIPVTIPASGEREQSFKRKQSFIYIGDKVYEVIKNEIVDLKSKQRFEFERNDEGLLIIKLDEITGNKALDKLLEKSPGIDFSEDPFSDFSPETAALIEQSI